MKTQERKNRSSLVINKFKTKSFEPTQTGLTECTTNSIEKQSNKSPDVHSK